MSLDDSGPVTAMTRIQNTSTRYLVRRPQGHAAIRAALPGALVAESWAGAASRAATRSSPWWSSVEMSGQRSENIRCIALCGAVKLYLDSVGFPGPRPTCPAWEHVRVRALRTPDERFAGLPGFGWEPRYADVGGLRMAYVEDGPAGGEPVLLLHGEPSWSFLYRTVMKVLADAGLRVIAADMIGFGRSDKPAEMGDHSYARHVEWTRALAFDALGLSGVTLVGQDWGGLIGLRLVAEHPDRFTRVVAANTGLPTGDHAMPQAN